MSFGNIRAKRSMKVESNRLKSRVVWSQLLRERQMIERAKISIWMVCAWAARVIYVI